MARFRIGDIPPAGWQNIIVQPIWDSEVVAPGQTAAIQYFINNSVGAVGQRKTLIDTNMPQAGFIPDREQFYNTGWMVWPVSRNQSNNGTFALTDITDFNALMDKAYWLFQIGSNGRALVQGHMAFFPAGIGTEGSVATGGATSGNIAHIIGSGQRRLDNAWSLPEDYAEIINGGEKWLGNLSFPAAVATFLSNSLTVRPVAKGLWAQLVR